ncbi:MAG: hypothetical protein DI613_09800 [Kocuria rhizophila]|uniref:hypothetical protein n=1 Tax=Kocuria carniphila TaxID=262208 RepID=UPI000DB15384|nr:MAG: hypothetical protein DI613_09800 [Kocuria rhizophila]
MSNPESLHSLHPDSLHHQDSAAPDIKHAAGIWLLLTILCQVYVILALLAYQLDWVQVLPPYLAVSAYILAMICVLGCVATARRYGQLREQYRHLTSGPRFSRLAFCEPADPTDAPWADLGEIPFSENTVFDAHGYNWHRQEDNPTVWISRTRHQAPPAPQPPFTASALT